MGRIKQKSDGKGSLRDIQILINHHPEFLNNELSKQFPKLKEFEWLSPIKEDEFAEYRDENFIQKIGVQPTHPLKEFWPSRGPQWDALGKSGSSPILVEAKANIPEIVSPGTQASDVSFQLIQKSLERVKADLNVKNEYDWTSTFYQYTNRIAHLWYLRTLNNIPAYLINVYFINDETVKGPKTKEEWEGAIALMKSFLGIRRHKLSKYMADIFINLELMKATKVLWDQRCS
ncbi:hypothetical protein SAMN05421640_3196 [Ekhidna lutea]|uniref:Uncharacterized protein n=1 Tax=Ekhidna lutea TaxID=447679 RepID=A0A239LGC1_EKHLU|nr:hypothetical protein SAMN05421640_3196 [Ekhidna lutea]